jgi:hypothetical protein
MDGECGGKEEKVKSKEQKSKDIIYWIDGNIEVAELSYADGVLSGPVHLQQGQLAVWEAVQV